MPALDLADSAIFGDPDARSALEQEGLRRYFLELPGFGDVATGRKTIVVGRKGTGKTAIRTRLLSPAPNVVAIDIEPLLPSHPLFREVAESGTDLSVPDFTTFAVTWRAFIVSSLLRRLQRDGILGFDDRQTVLSYASWVNSPNRQVAFWKRLQEVAGASDRLTALRPDLSAITSLPSEAEVADYLKIIDQACRHRKYRIVALLDRIDQQLEAPLLGPLFLRYARYLGGLCLTAAQISAAVPSRNLCVYVFAREDLLDEFQPHLHSSNEFEGLIYKIPWRMDHLMEFLAMRISSATGARYDPRWDYQRKRDAFFKEGIFHAVFENFKADGLSLWKYLLVHTHMRPRDLISLCNECRNEAATSQKMIIDDASLNRGFHTYSLKRYRELVATYRWMVTAFQEFIDSFRGRAMRYTTAELIAHVTRVARDRNVRDLSLGDELATSPQSLVRLLYKSGFIVAREVREQRLPYVAHYVEPHLDTAKQRDWLVHPAFLRELAEGAPSPNVGDYLDNNDD